MATVVFNGERIETRIGETIFDAASRSEQGAEEIASSCAQAGVCRECIVEITAGQDGLTPWSPEEASLTFDTKSHAFK